MTLAPWVIWLLPIIASPIVLLVSLVNNKLCMWFAASVTGLTAAIGLYQAVSFTHQYSESLGTWVAYSSISLEVKVDGLSVLLSTFISFLSFIIVLYAVENMKQESSQARFYSLVLLFIGAMLALVMAGNLIQLYFFWEVVGICSALLIAFWNDRQAALKAGLKAFVVTRFGDIALLAAAVLILTTFHTTNFDAITSFVHGQGSTATWSLIGMLILIGAMGKSAQVPLHVWLPDAMEGPTPVSALIHAATMVNAGVYLIVRMSPIFAASTLLSTSVLIVGLLSVVVGALCACAENDLKRILAYSTISQIGIMFAAVGMGSLSGAVYQLISQGLFKALAFMAAGSVIEVVGTRNIENMGGLMRVMKYTYVAFLFSVLSMVGLPPLMGFWAKDSILSTALSVNEYAFLTIALASIFTAFYGFRALIKVFHVPKTTDAKESGSLMIIPMLVLVLSVLTGWLVLSRQHLVLPPLSESLRVITSFATISALVLGLVISYDAFLARREVTPGLIQTSFILRGAISFLRKGLGFDSLYAVLVKFAIGSIVRRAKIVQSGILGNNIALLLSVLVLLVLLIATGVI